MAFQLGDFPQYVALFVVGIVAGRRGWFDALTARDGRRWSIVAIGCAIALPIVGLAAGAIGGDASAFLGGLRWEACVGAVWSSLQGTAIIVALLALFRARRNRQGTLAGEAARAAYAAYVLHAPILILVSLAVRPIALAPAGKFLLVGTAGVVACFAVAAGVRRLPLAQKVL